LHLAIAATADTLFVGVSSRSTEINRDTALPQTFNISATVSGDSLEVRRLIAETLAETKKKHAAEIESLKAEIVDLKRKSLATQGLPWITVMESWRKDVLGQLQIGMIQKSDEYYQKQLYLLSNEFVLLKELFKVE
jgi:hypothetical protein